MRKALLATLIGITMLLTGCGGSKGVDSPIGATSPTHSSTLSQEEALRVLYQELLAKTEHTVAFLKEAKVGDQTIYAFQHMVNGRAPVVDFVHSKTGKVYYDSVELLLDIFINSEDKEPYKVASYINKDIYYLEMKSVNDPEPTTWSTYVFNEDAYTSAEEAKKAVVKVYAENHPTLSLLGKPLAEVEKITKIESQKVPVETEEGGAAEATQINLDNTLILFNNEAISSEIFLEGQQEILGVKIGEPFNEVSDKLGMPDSFGQDSEFGDIYTMRYLFDGFQIEFYGEDKDANTISALIKKL
ncbi:hypothetical protein [Desulfitobacterium sp. PCE1]|uniref:hypothetical protein n=1 Tax=Desulfitobacterium sp. PCE1 TaxID=146907 RepID=UPI00036CA49A|nr:hypothetical protein [Desulfitobacterium sp. PCE1]